MGIANLPDEVMGLIMGNLTPDVNPYGMPLAPPTHLLSARLVSRKWNSLSTPYAFYTIPLQHTDPFGEGLKKWNALLECNTVKFVARRAKIHSSPHDLVRGRIGPTWTRWEVGEYPQFTNAINGIKHLPRLDEVHLFFSRHCSGVGRNDRDDQIEKITTRRHTLQAAFEAIQRRAATPGCSTIRSLRIENLQNIPLSDFTSSDLFRSVTKDLTQLHLWVTEEINHDNPDQDLYCIERSEFEPYLHSEWLVPMSSNLTELTLYFAECWGVMPGIFEGDGLEFPQLKKLKLGYFTIAHHDHFNWVLAQTSIQYLYMERCFIASYISCDTDQLDLWDTSKRDWVELPTGSYGFTEFTEVFYFPGTWEAVFDSIRTRLPNLIDYCFITHERYLGGFNDSRYFFFSRPNMYPGEISPLRYIAFQESLCPSSWIEATAPDGELEFGNGDPGVFDEDSGEDRWAKRGVINRSKETKEGDHRAYHSLQAAVSERRRRQLQ